MKEWRIWKREGYVIKEVPLDADLNEFDVVRNDGKLVGTITPDNIESMNVIIKDFDEGECVEGWETGEGKVVFLWGGVLNSFLH